VEKISSGLTSWKRRSATVFEIIKCEALVNIVIKHFEMNMVELLF
jgi:hypothetical protein